MLGFDLLEQQMLQIDFELDNGPVDLKTVEMLDVEAAPALRPLPMAPLPRSTISGSSPRSRRTLICPLMSMPRLPK